jgi:hypothetical protein
MAELNQSLRFDQLSIDQQHSFTQHPQPILVRMDKGFEVYKWTQYPFVSSRGTITEYWSPWEAMRFNDQHVPGFVELRKRYANRPGEVGRPQEFMRARSAVTNEWNDMSSLTKAQLLEPVWGFLGLCRHQRVSNAANMDHVFFIGGNFQLVIPNLSLMAIKKL